MKGPLFRLHELAFRTQYAELKERASSTEFLLPGSPGTLVKRSATGRSYWYRAYQEATGKQVEDLVCRDTDENRYEQAVGAVAFAKWMGAQVRILRKLEFQVADKGVARVLVELHNTKLLADGLCVVGTLGYMAWLNELGARAVTARTQDIDLAASQSLKLAAPASFLDVIAGTKLGFHPVPGLTPGAGSSSVKLAGAEGLRVDILTPGTQTGLLVDLPALHWHGQTIAHYDYLLQDTRAAAILAGGHCIPVRLPAPERFVWHKLYSGIVRKNFPEKALKDLRQATALAAVLTEQDEYVLPDSATELPPGIKKALTARMAVLLKSLDGSPPTQNALKRALINT
ncbi:GSU2403 family nucleotidyltransferase fold protein [Piscinibacter sp.]|uniref:GSU2403 family nucleotidyltransferase fold protein n=1 Tax=Piscinibacter sp. TaxID=1903157 RepID=UPI002D7F132D|nr:GSU2403 family nucleotidyltransferase fold protein [Albitalea sp.]